MKKLSSLFLFGFCLVSGLAAQGEFRIDSLQSVLKSTTSDTAQIRIYHLLSLETKQDLERAAHFEEQALAIATKTGDRTRISNCLAHIGTLYRNQSGYRKSIPYYKKSIAAAENTDAAHLANVYLELGIAYLRITQLDSSQQALEAGLVIARKYGDLKTVAGIYNSLGNVRKDENNFKAAIDYYLKATDLFQKLRDDAGLTQALSNVGNVQALMGNYDKALDYAQQSLDIAKTIDKKSSIAYSNRLLGRIYRKIRKYNEALEMYDNAIKTYQELNAKRDAGETYLNKGNIYYEMENFPMALHQYFESLKIVRAIADTANMVYAYSAIGMAYDEVNNHKRAFRYLDSALVFSEKMGQTHITMDIHDALSELYAEEGNFKSAYNHHLLFTQVRDSLQTIQNAVDAKELEARYQAEKREEQIKTLNAQNELKALQLDKSAEARNYLVGLIALCVVLIGVIFSRYRIKQKTARKLEELDEMKSRFFANISHEFRTPLSLILGPLQRKIDQTDDHQEKGELQVMERSALRLQTLINQLLDLSKLEAGHMNLKVAKENLRHFFGVILSAFSSFAEHRNITYDYYIDNLVNDGLIDRDKVEKIVYNLLSNAFKFTDVDGRVHVSIKVDHGFVIVEICDDGPGIPKDILPKIFNRFFQADDSFTRPNEGTGIGLALSKELTELHHGELSATSKPGAGSCFTLRIPIHQSDYKPHEVANSSEPFLEASMQPPSQLSIDEHIQDSSDATLPLVVIVEDHPDMRDFIAATLRDEYRVVLARDGEEGLQKSLDLVPELVVSDLMMPGFDGRELCKRIKSNDATSHIPVIILTARADQSSKIQALGTGADDYLTKPFNARELRVRVKNLIDQRRKLRELFRQQIVLAPQQLQLASPDAHFLEKVIALLEKHHENAAFGVEAFTMEIGLSRMQLHRKLKALTDKSPGEFIRQFRLDRAKQLLVLKGISISDVAYRTGFNNLSNFTKVFKEYTGITPSEFVSKHSAEILQNQK